MSKQTPRRLSIRFKHNPSISYTTPQKTCNTLPPELMIQLPKETYDSFLKLLSIASIKTFSSKCKDYHLKQLPTTRKELSLRKPQFLSFLKSSFSPDDKYSLLYEQLFRRFTTLKCELNKQQDTYYINSISNEDEVNVYEFSCALVCFLKNDFNVKLKLLFELTDKDDDGYINITELRRMIYVINSLFSEEEKPIETNSAIIHQSLASIKSRQCYLLIMKQPGELSKIFMKNKYVNYNEFYNAVITIPEYRYKLFPFYINFHKCLLSSKNEQHLIIKKNIYNEFTTISNNLITHIKTDNDIGKTFTDFKKSLEPIPYQQQLTLQVNNDNINDNNLFFRKPNSYHGNILRGGSAFISRNSGIIKKTQTKYTHNSHLSTEYTINSAKRNTYGGYNTFYKRKFRKRKEDKFKINLNKINGLETFPKKITIDDDIISNTNGNESPIIKKTFPNKNRCVSSKVKSIINTCSNSIIANAYMTFNEIISDINIQRDKHKIRNQAPEMLNRLDKKVENTAMKFRKKLKDQNPNESSKPFGRIDISSRQKPFM